MKKLSVVLVVLLLVLTACKKEVKNGVEKIKLQQFFEMMDKQETMVVYFGTSTCSACLEYKPNVEEVAKNYDIVIYYVELDAESKEDKERLASEYIDSLEFTPTTYFIQGGEVAHRFVGSKGYRDLKKELVDYGFIEEN